MTESRLRNHIPLSAPATREPCTGDEQDLRVSLGFVPGSVVRESCHLQISAWPSAKAKQVPLPPCRLTAGIFPHISLRVPVIVGSQMK